MSAYLNLETKERDIIFSISRNNDLVSFITDNYRIEYDGVTSLENINESIEEINEYIDRSERRRSLALIKGDFDIDDFLNDEEYLISLYDTRGQLHLINNMLIDNLFYKSGLFFTYG